jgi:fucose 4-O-acetylase-like acetyltransferase
MQPVDHPSTALSAVLPTSPAVGARLASAPPISNFVSAKIRFWGFMSMVLLVFVHGYNMADRYLEPWTLPGEPLRGTTFISYWLANGLFRFRIPMLFLISGFLFARSNYRGWKSSMGRRVSSLLIPYLLFSALSLLLFFVLEFGPAGREIVANSHMMQIDERRLYLHEYKWWEVLLRWVLAPPAYQLWFIRVLLIYNLLYLPIRWCVLHPIVQKVWFIVVGLLWISTFNLFFIEGEGLFFFSLGIWIQKKGFNIEQPSRWLRPLPWALTFGVLSLVKTGLAFKGVDLLDEGTTRMAMTLIHKGVIFSGLVTAWYGGDALVKYFMSKTWFLQASAFSLIIYGLHAPLVALLIDPFHSLVDQWPLYRLFTFFALPLLLLGALLLTGMVMKKLTPRFFMLLTGGRGG